MRYRQKQNQILVQSVLGVLKCLFPSPFGVAKRFSHFFSTPWLKLRGSNSSSCDVSRRGKTVLKYPIKKKKKRLRANQQLNGSNQCLCVCLRVITKLREIQYTRIVPGGCTINLKYMRYIKSPAGPIESASCCVHERYTRGRLHTPKSSD